MTKITKLKIALRCYFVGMVCLVLLGSLGLPYVYMEVLPKDWENQWYGFGIVFVPYLSTTGAIFYMLCKFCNLKDELK